MLPSVGLRLATVSSGSELTFTWRVSVALLPAASLAERVSVWLPTPRLARFSAWSKAPVPGVNAIAVLLPPSML